jgi:hypothetical protein
MGGLRFLARIARTRVEKERTSTMLCLMPLSDLTIVKNVPSDLQNQKERLRFHVFSLYACMFLILKLPYHGQELDRIVVVVAMVSSVAVGIHLVTAPWSCHCFRSSWFPITTPLHLDTLRHYNSRTNSTQHGTAGT